MPDRVRRARKWVLESLIDGGVVNEITVPDDVKRDSLVALQRMLELR